MQNYFQFLEILRYFHQNLNRTKITKYCQRTYNTASPISFNTSSITTIRLASAFISYVGINALLHMDTYRWPLMHSIMNLSMSYEVRTTFKNNKHLILFGGSVWVLVLLCLKRPHRHSYSPPLSLILTPNLLLIRHTSCITHSLTWAFKSRAHNSQHFFPLSSPHPFSSVGIIDLKSS